MRLRAFEVKSSGPIKLVGVSELSDIVVLAGPNGVGKTSINNALLNFIRGGGGPNVWVEVEATNEYERLEWKKPVLDTRIPSDIAALMKTLRRNQRRNRYQSSFLNFDSNRTVRNIQGYSFGWDIGDPFAEDTSWEFGLNPLSNRYNDVWHSLFRLVEGQRRKIAETAVTMRASGATTMALDFPDLLEPFKVAFWRLLAPKKLIDVNVRDQQIYYEYEGKSFPFPTLSSGESEVVNIVFDFILRNPQDSIIIFDEPELHLHPELTYKLLQTLAQTGHRNQFIFCSHSPDVISASLDHTVIFISPPKGGSR